MEPENRVLPKRRLMLPAGSSASPVFQKKGSSRPAAAAAAASMVRVVDCAPAAAYVAEEDTDALDCGVCFFPLRPPIFQCGVGHVVCAPCRDGLAAAGGTGRCHVCGVATAYRRRCHAMERLLESIRVACPNAAHGCAARLAYYEQQAHRVACAHGPCRCPGVGCGFVGSTAALFAHFSGPRHGWPCATVVRDGGTRRDLSLVSLRQLRQHLSDDYFGVRLRDGFNFLLVVRRGSSSSTTDETSDDRYLFLLNVARLDQPVAGRAVSVLWIHPESAAASSGAHQLGPWSSSSKEMECSLRYTSSWYVDCPSGNTQRFNCEMSAKFRVACTDLSSGQLLGLDGTYQFVVPDYAVADGDKDAIQLTAFFDI